MTSADPTPAAETAPSDTLEGQSYEIIRKRLAAGAAELRTRLDRLNASRKEVFGSIETALLSTERITTANNCVPRDLLAIGQHVLLGYNVHIGLRKETQLADVFAAYQFADKRFAEENLSIISNPQFEKDFQELYKYYRQARFAKFAVRGPHLFMVFQVGQTPADVKTFRWAIDGEQLTYLDNRSDHLYKYPPQHEFEWLATTRDQHRSGKHPHISINDIVFVETVGGDLTIKVENNTDSGQGIYSEPVEDPDQTLDDAEIRYAVLGNIVLLKIRPYNEKAFRHIVFNRKTQEARRIDAIADSCVLLPDDHGLIFPGGYYLQTGVYKTFDSRPADMLYESQIRAANGEDTLYVFHNRGSGEYLLLSYNLIAQQVDTPLACHGFALFPNGQMLTFRHDQEPQKHHVVQVWQTPFADEELIPATQTDSLLYKIGNRDLVRAMAECHEVLALLGKDDSYGSLYVDIVKRTTSLVDAYFWLDRPDCAALREPLDAIRAAAASAIGEFEKVVQVKRHTRTETERVAKQVSDAVKAIAHESFNDIGGFVRSLSALRTCRGEAISLRELRYADLPAIDALEATVRKNADELAQRCVEFLLQPDSLKPYEQQVVAQQARLPGLAKVADAKLLDEEIGVTARELEMLIETASNLKIDDATQRTAIIDAISAIFSRLNQTRSALKARLGELATVEGAAEFHAGLKLLSQSVVNYLDVCDTPARCEEYLTKVMIQLEELEGRFAQFDAFIEQLAAQREEIYNAFESRRLALVEARNRRADVLLKSAERILKGCQGRIDGLKTVVEINGYFASDLMIQKVRDLATELGELGDSVKVDDLQSRLKTLREDAVRQLKDRQELFVAGENVIQFGRHKFNVNTQLLDLTTIIRDSQMFFHLSGTNFFEPIVDPALDAAKAAWSQPLVSENETVYRGEYLAYLMLAELGQGVLPTAAEVAGMGEDAIRQMVQQFMAPRYSEGYVKGVHDHDAAKILLAAATLRTSIGLLQYSASARATAVLYWIAGADGDVKQRLAARLRGFGRIGKLFTAATRQEQYIAQLARMIADWDRQRPDYEMPAATASAASAAAGPSPANAAATTRFNEAAEYLFQVLAFADGFAVSHEASELVTGLRAHLEKHAASAELVASLDKMDGDTLSAFNLARDWMRAFVDEHPAHAPHAEFLDEAALLLLENEFDETRVVRTPVSVDLAGLVGDHAAIVRGAYRFHYNRFMSRLAQFAAVAVPRYESYTRRKHELVEARRAKLRLDEFRPHVLTSFVRNKLIDKVYLPLVGDNLAKQIGVAGEQKRTDRMGLLLLVSPPGYGKTTLMEYVANRLGLIFMKINGPAIGHDVTSLDPNAAPNASAREEVERINLALEMGDNVMLYLDDIQHCNPELLQKFISLCDGQRKIEGVYQGRTRTYDLRGRRVCVVMAGNPYTESGEKFKIPDMLANRADTYNLGEIIGDNADVFELSYLENALTSNPTLAPLASKQPQDIYPIIRLASEGRNISVDLVGAYSASELDELIATVQKLLTVRDVLLKVNRQYIASAAQADDYRVEPAFKLQGSYRNMNRIAEKVSPLLNEAELNMLIDTAYENDAQTLTTGAEANLLKFKELIGRLSPTEAQRWQDICRTFRENVRLRGVSADDKIGQVIARLGTFSDGLDSIRKALSDGADKLSQPFDIEPTVVEPPPPQTLSATFAPEALAALEQMAASLASSFSAGEAQKHKIEITNKLPRSVLAVIREQFKLMETWLAPLAEAGRAQSAAVDDLKKQLARSLAEYRTLLADLKDDA